MSRPRPTLATASLLPQERLARSPLAPWARNLLRNLDSWRSQTRRSYAFALEAAEVLNNGALIAAHMGRRELAADLCKRQMRWQLRLARRSRNPAIATLAIQPWVNLGRLDAMAGEWELALSRFHALRGFRPHASLQLGTFCVKLAGDLPGGTKDFARFVAAVQVFDVLKALLLNRRFSETLAFAGEVGASFGYPLALAADEACVVAHAHRGELEAALDRARTAPAGRGWPRAAFQVRQAEVLACVGERDRAAALLAPVLHAMAQLPAARWADLQVLQLGARAAAVWREVEHDGEAAATARKVLEGAALAHDEVFRIESLRLLAEAAPVDERGRWAELLDEAEETTEYRRFRRGGQAPPNPVIEELFARLQDLFAN